MVQTGEIEMKVIKRVPWSHKFTCRGCKSELEAEPNDVRFGEFGAVAYAGESGEMKFYVRCTVCESDHILKDSVVPQDIANGAKRDK